MKTSCWMVFLLLVCALRGVEPTAPLLTPGSTLTLDFPELGKMHDERPAACEVSIPKNYDPAHPVPLFVWFSGGRGAHTVAGARGLVDFDTWVVVALPYPDGLSPRQAAEDYHVEDHWTFHRAMLARIETLLPNIDSVLRIAAGTSNGAHYLGYGLDQQWPGFGRAFKSFILHEGGAAPISSAIPGARGRRLLVCWGTRSESIDWRLWFNDRIAVVGANVTFLPIAGAGHGLNEDGRRAIRKWVDELAKTTVR